MSVLASWKNAVLRPGRAECLLAAGIADGTYPAGSQLPNEDELVERHAVSRTTIRQTIQNLVRRGLVEIRRGNGTFVLPPKITQELTELSGFVEDMQSLGRQASARLLDKQIVPASESVARQLAVPAGTLVVRIQRVRLADNYALSFDETYLPRAIGERIIENYLETEPIFSLLEQKYDTPLVEAEFLSFWMVVTETWAQGETAAEGKQLPHRSVGTVED